jgi:coenzyme F420 biosynthesis associated uncharacterized protein
LVDLVDWGLAEKVAVRAAGREPFAGSYHERSLGPDFDELTAQAEELVAVETGLRSAAGPAKAKVIDRAEWVRANIASFQRLLHPLTEKMADRLQGPAALVMPRAAGLEVGLLLGWMSGRVLGQYDLLVASEPTTAPSGPLGSAQRGDDSDFVYYVGPNLLALEKRFAFPPREFRLWLALHETTHRAQFTGVPWMKEHYLGLVDKTLGAVDTDPKRLFDAVRRTLEETRAGGTPLGDGLAHLLAGPEQRDALDQIGGLMSLLEGHGDVTMDRAGAGLIPSAPRFGRVLRNRRKRGSATARLIQRLLGLEAKLNQYEQGEHFIAEVERLGGGPEALEPVWRGPQWLPTLTEIRDPADWLARVRLSEELVGGR